MSKSMGIVSIEGRHEGQSAERISAIFRKVALGKELSRDEFRAIVDCVVSAGSDPEREAARLCYLVPLDSLDVWFNDTWLADHRDLDDDAFAKITDQDRISFARELLANLGDALDADLHPGLLALAITDGTTQIVLGYSVSGYSFSGIEVTCISYGRDQAALLDRLRREYLLIDDAFFITSLIDQAVATISDELILGSWRRSWATGRFDLGYQS
jgi:hypothetical protein